MRVHLLSISAEVSPPIFQEDCFRDALIGERDVLFICDMAGLTLEGLVQDGRSNLEGTAGASTGVYVGCVWQEYQVLIVALYCYCPSGKPFHWEKFMAVDHLLPYVGS